MLARYEDCFMSLLVFVWASLYPAFGRPDAWLIRFSQLRKPSDTLEHNELKAWQVACPCCVRAGQRPDARPNVNHEKHKTSDVVAVHAIALVVFESGVSPHR